jgi:hypothetical protein
VSPDLEVRITSQALDQAAAQRIADSEWPPNALSVKAGRHSSRLPKRLTSKKDQGELFIGAHATVAATSAGCWATERLTP